MTITETTEKKPVPSGGDIVSITQPRHVRVVSIGAFLLLASMSILIVDLFTYTLLWWMSYDLIGIYYYTVEAFVLSFRVLGIVLFVMILWIGFLGKPLYSGRPGRIMQKLLFLGVNVFLYFHVSIGVGIWATIALFLWTPRILLDKKPGTIELYRAIAMGGTLTWMILEIILTALGDLKYNGGSW